MTRDEAQSLKKKAKAACMTEARLIRLLLEGYTPKPVPDDRFYESMDQLKVMGDRLEHISDGCRSPEDSAFIAEEAKKWHAIQLDMEKKYLLPERRDEKWQ